MGMSRENEACARARGMCGGDGGQMTVEMAVAFPVLLVVAIVAVNALTFISECASFDRLARQAVRVHAVAPAYGQGAGASCALVQQQLETAFNAENLQVSVSRAATEFDFDLYTLELEYAPTLFGMGLRSEVLGIQMPHLHHRIEYVVDVYKPGVVV